MRVSNCWYFNTSHSSSMPGCFSHLQGGGNGGGGGGGGGGPNNNNGNLGMLSLNELVIQTSGTSKSLLIPCFHVCSSRRRKR